MVDLSKGEILDVITELAIDVDHYLTIADLKTGSLFSAAAGIGGVLGGATPEEVDCLYNYGRAVGIAFQIKDDILDSPGNPQTQDRVNLVLMHYLDEATKQGRSERDPSKERELNGISGSPRESHRVRAQEIQRAC